MSTPPATDPDRLHDLALVYVALVYGTDHDLGEAELERVVEAVARWDPHASFLRAREAVVEAMALFYDDPREVSDLLLDALRRLYESLSPEAREAALDDAVALAEADGRLLLSERAFLDTIAEAWHLRRRADALLSSTTATATDDWSALHDVALLFQVVANTAEAPLSSEVVVAMVVALCEWQPGLAAEAAGEVLRRAADYFTGRPEAVRDAAERLGAGLSLLHRLALLSDLQGIALADGALTHAEREALATFKDAWGLGRGA